MDIFQTVVTGLESQISQNLLSGLAGGVIGGFFSVWGVSKQIRHADKTRKEESEEEAQNKKRDATQEIRNIVSAIETEMSTLWKRYNERGGKAISALKPGDILEGSLVVSKDYFVLYQSNAHRFGLITDDNLRSLIVRTYVCARALEDRILQNNYYLNERASAARAGVPDAVENLRDTARLVKLGHDDVERCIKELEKQVQKLRANGDLGRFHHTTP